MALVFAAVVPHSPILVPAIGKEHTKLFTGTTPALARVAGELYASRPDVLLLITPHAPALEDAFSFIVGPTLRVSFRDFGDLATDVAVPGDVGFAQELRGALETIAVTTIRQLEPVDYGLGVPLRLLAPPGGIRTVGLACSKQSPRAHFDFGATLRDHLLNAKKRVAVLASAELAHTLAEHAPAGYSPRAKQYDETVQRAIRSSNPEPLLTMPADLIEAAAACGTRPIATLFGVLDGTDARSELLSYEAPFGVGLLVATFRLA